MKVDDIIRLEIESKIRVWRVTGIYLGSARQEDVIGIEALDLHPNDNATEMLVPRHMIESITANDQDQRQERR